MTFSSYSSTGRRGGGPDSKTRPSDTPRRCEQPRDGVPSGVLFFHDDSSARHQNGFHERRSGRMHFFPLRSLFRRRGTSRGAALSAPNSCVHIK